MIKNYVRYTNSTSAWFDGVLCRTIRKDQIYYDGADYYDIDNNKLGIVDSNPDNEDDETFISNVETVVQCVLKAVTGELDINYIRVCHKTCGPGYGIIGSLFHNSSSARPIGTFKFERDGDDWSILVWGISSALVLNFLNTLRKALPSNVYDEPEKDVSQVPISFWRMGRTYGDIRHNSKNITCPALEETQSNYIQVRDELPKLFTIENPTKHGKIVLWHGPPGMGKTYAIRSLARNWHYRLGASIEIVLDPENLFGNADYMHDLILNGRTGLRLIIVEDSEEFFDRNQKESRQGFARLLNLTDGIIGQGTEVVFMLTANAAFEKIDEAVIRPGRCLQVMEFSKFLKDEATAWISQHLPATYNVTQDKEFALTDETTLAELYALRNRICPPAEETDDDSGDQSSDEGLAEAPQEAQEVASTSV